MPPYGRGAGMGGTSAGWGLLIIRGREVMRAMRANENMTQYWRYVFGWESTYDPEADIYLTMCLWARNRKKPFCQLCHFLIGEGVMFKRIAGKRHLIPCPACASWNYDHREGATQLSLGA